MLTRRNIWFGVGILVALWVLASAITLVGFLSGRGSSTTRKLAGGPDGSDPSHRSVVVTASERTESGLGSPLPPIGGTVWDVTFERRPPAVETTISGQRQECRTHKPHHGSIVDLASA
jgi:hypothetical protein